MGGAWGRVGGGGQGGWERRIEAFMKIKRYIFFWGGGGGWGGSRVDVNGEVKFL